MVLYLDNLRSCFDPIVTVSLYSLGNDFVPVKIPLKFPMLVPIRPLSAPPPFPLQPFRTSLPLAIISPPSFAPRLHNHYFFLCFPTVVPHMFIMFDDPSPSIIFSSWILDYLCPSDFSLSLSLASHTAWSFCTKIWMKDLIMIGILELIVFLRVMKDERLINAMKHMPQKKTDSIGVHLLCSISYSLFAPPNF